MSTSRNSFGTRRKRGNKWYGEFRHPYQKGKIVRLGRGFTRKAELEHALREQQLLIERGEWVPLEQQQAQQRADSLTVGEWVKSFFTSLQRDLKPSTAQKYWEQVNSRILYSPAPSTHAIHRLKGIPLRALTRQDVFDWWEGVNGYNPDTRSANSKAYTRLKQAMSEAVRRELIPANPVDIPAKDRKVEVKDKPLPTDNDLAAIIDGASGVYKPILVLCLYHGLRIGEALGLESQHILVERDSAGRITGVEIKVEQNLVRLTETTASGAKHTYMSLQAPKTKAGRRPVPVFRQFWDLIAPLAQKTHEVTVDSSIDGRKGTVCAGLVFTTSSGRPVMDTSVRNYLDRVKEHVGVTSDISPHSGRRWLITRMAERGATPREIGQVLGQTDLKTITEIYMKVRESRPGELMRAVAESL